MKRTLPKGRNGSCEPLVEVFKLRSLQWVRQLRRLQTLMHVVKKANDLDIVSHPLQQQIEREWKAITHAPGFRGGFSGWCLNQADVGVWYVKEPPLGWFESLTGAFKVAVDYMCNAEASARDNYASYTSQLDFLHFGGSAAFSKIKPPSPQPVEFLWKDLVHV